MFVKPFLMTIILIVYIHLNTSETTRSNFISYTSKFKKKEVCIITCRTLLVFNVT